MDNKSELSKPVAWLAIYHGEVYDEAISITRSVVEAQAERFGWESALTEITPLYRHAQSVPANAQIAGHFVRQRPEWDKRAPWTQWKEVDEASYADIIKIIATGEAYCGWFYDNRILYTAPPAPAPAVQDEIDSFADQVIGTKDKIIRLPAPMPVPLEGIRVYLNADAIISYLEKQGYIVEVSRE